MTLVKRASSDDYKFLLFIGNMVGWHNVDDVDIVKISLGKFVNEKLFKILNPVDIQQSGNAVLDCGACPLKSQHIRRYGRDH
jgi:hypothetical protein